MKQDNAITSGRWLSFITVHTAALLFPLFLFPCPILSLLKPQNQYEVTKGHAVWPRTALRTVVFQGQFEKRSFKLRTSVMSHA